MSVVIKVLGVAGMPGLTEYDGLYIASFQDTPDGVGAIGFVTLAAEAMWFLDADDALQYWRQVSKTVPLRPDGLPNRPLTAFTVELESTERG